MKQRLAAIVAFVQGLKVVRVVQQYTTQRGPILAGGLSYQAIFAVFAGLWVSFSVAGIVVQSTPELRDALFATINQSVPGLISDGDSEGAIDRETLLSTGALTWTGIVALAGLLFTALGWLASGRDAVRTMFKLPPDSLNFFLMKLKDLGLALGFGVTLLVSAGVSLGSTAALSWVFETLGMSDRSAEAAVTARVVGLLIAFVIDCVTLGVFYRIVASVKIPLRQLIPGAVLGGAGLVIGPGLGLAGPVQVEDLGHGQGFFDFGGVAGRIISVSRRRKVSSFFSTTGARPGNTQFCIDSDLRRIQRVIG